MLSILTKQAKLLEKELKDKQKECLVFRQEAEEYATNIEARDLRIAFLEAELAALLVAPLQNEAAVPTEESTGEFPAQQQDEQLSDQELDNLKDAITALQDKLGNCEGKLTFAELRASMLSLHKSTLELTHVGVVQKFEASLKTAQEEVSALRARHCAAEDLSLELEQAKADVGRRDEQLEFLLHVHDASSGYDWVPGHGNTALSSNGHDSASREAPSTPRIVITPRGGGLPVGSAFSAASMLSGNSEPLCVAPSHNSADVIAALAELGVDTATANAALEAAGGDLDRAVLAIFPAD
jgi:hypothetical protein